MSKKKIEFSGGIAAASMLFFGTISSVTSKVQMLFTAPGYHGIVHYFEKPGFQVFTMFFSMSFAIFICPYWGPKGPINLRDYSFRKYLLPIFTSILGTIATFVMTAGLTRISVSIYMMLRGGLSIFSSIFSIIFLKRHILTHQWIGIGLNFISLIIVGISGTLSTSDSRHSWIDRLIGVLMVIGSIILQGAQLVWDEYMLQDLNIPIMLVVAMEGIWGVLISLFCVIPLCFIIPGNDPSQMGGSLENIFDSFIMLGNSWQISLILLASCIAILGYDSSGMTVTSTMSSVHRTIFEALRTLTTWIFMLFITACGSPYGEHWNKWSWLQLAGFCLLVVSSLIFNGVIHVGKKKENEQLLN